MCISCDYKQAQLMKMAKAVQQYDKAETDYKATRFTSESAKKRMMYSMSVIKEVATKVLREAKDCQLDIF